jgi:hypothetical protein
MANSKISNSLSYFLEQALILEKNSLETVSKINDAVTSQKDTVTLTLTDPKNPSNTIKYSIPSFGFLKSEIERLDNSIKTISNIDSGSGSRIQLSDGTYRKIIASKIACEAPTITTTNNITNFNFKSNWLFEDMMNPYLYANVDLSNCIPVETERVFIQRYILNCTTNKQLEYFDSIKSNSTKIDYKSFLKGLLNNGITYVLDENYYDLPPIRRRYSGEFEINRILENTLSSDGKNILGRIILKSLSYTDNNSGIVNTVTLSKNDILEVKENPVTTRYMVTYVDASTNEIKLKRLEGYSPITNGTIFRISSNQVKNFSVEIPVSFDRREVLFIKAIDRDSNIPSDKWSPGIAFYSNELKYTSPQGVTNKLETFYQKNVVDFGNIILSYTKDYYPSIVEGIKPDAPVLHYDSEDNTSSDFKIVQINKQLEEGTEANTFKKLIADKETALSQINNNNKLVEQQKELIQTTKFKTTTEKLNAQSKLAEYVKNQEIYTSSYSSIVNQIKSQYAATYMEKPKYRVRGFWSIPSPKISKSSGPQQIIQFKVRYRYLSESGVANKEDEFTYLDGTTNATGRFSNWNEVLTPMRRRVKGSDGTYIWEKVNTSDPEQININQLDLPIQNGEQIEIQIKSISEAGFPSNPMESDWSESVIIAFSDFPELQGDDISEIIAQNRIDASVANVMDSITKNTNAHMSSSFYTNDKYFAHNAESITSGFLSPEQTPITLYDKLYDLQNQITSVTEQIERMSATLDVKLIDGEDNTKIYTLTEGGTTYIYAGNYTDDKKKIDNDKRNGAIITKTYYIEISSDLQSGLEILSKIPGDRLSMCPNTISEVSDMIASEKPNTDIKRNDYKNYDNVLTPNSIASDYYKSKGRYDLVPINLSGSDIIDYQICSPNMYQSAQCKGQFIYSRFRNVSDTFDMYGNTTDSNNAAIFDPKADFIKSENTYKFRNNAKDDNFWIERFNFYKPSSYVTDISSLPEDEEEKFKLKKEIFNHIVQLYDYLTGSSVSPVLYYTEEDKTLYMWKKYGETEKEYAARNIITDGMPEIDNEDNFDISIVGIYYIDSNNNFDIYTDQTKNYIIKGFNDYYTENKEQILIWNWKDTKTKEGDELKGTDTFVLNKDFYYYTETITDGKKEKVRVDGGIQMKNSYDIINQIEVVLNRLPKTYNKSQTALKTLYSDAKVIMRLNNLLGPTQMKNKTFSNNTLIENSLSRNATQSTVSNSSNSLINKNTLQQSLVRANKIATRSSVDVKSVNTASMNQIEPKIQAAYGFADFGKIKNLNVDGYLSMDDGSYVTTHKIGYEDNDRFRTGSSTCDSYLFLSPLNHSEIQVNGDTNKSHAFIKSNESLRVPIIYQYRMEDYNGSIFGNSGYKSSDAVVNNTKYANIIGIDIWLNTLSDTPKQYDIVVYSTYNKGNERKTGTVTNKIQGSIMQVNAQINSTQNDNHISL